MTEKEEMEYKMRDEYDLSDARPSPYAARAHANSKLVRIDPDFYELFPTSESANAALRLVVKAGELTTRPQAKAS